ncbi:transposase [Roseibium album]|uniref:transposase n=1 Tax=Roseibium album TaxID=311410 RepID=UPI0038B67601
MGDEFNKGRHLAVWVGLVPKQHSSGDRSTLMGMSKRGNQHLRSLLDREQKLRCEQPSAN